MASALIDEREFDFEVPANIAIAVDPVIAEIFE